MTEDNFVFHNVYFIKFISSKLHFAYKTKTLFANSWHTGLVYITTQFILNNQVYYSSYIKVHLKHLDTYSFSSGLTFIATTIFVQFI